jgi:hypothetical protein
MYASRSRGVLRLAAGDEHGDRVGVEQPHALPHALVREAAFVRELNHAATGHAEPERYLAGRQILGRLHEGEGSTPSSGCQGSKAIRGLPLPEGRV